MAFGMRMRINRDPDIDGGGSGGNIDTINEADNGGAADSSAHSSGGDNSNAGGDSGAADNSNSDAGSGDAGDSYILTKMPERGTPEYMEKFNELSIEDSVKLEAEINSLYNESDPELLKLMTPADGDATDDTGDTDGDKGGDDTGEKAGDDAGNKGGDDTGDKGDAVEYKSITKDVFAKLPADVQTTLKAMNQELKDAEPYMSQEFKAGFDAINKDPVIQNRLQELKDGNSGVQDYIKKSYNPNEHVSKDDIGALDFSSKEKRKESVQKISDMLHEAAQKGHNIATNNHNLAQAETNAKIDTKIAIERQLNKMVADNPSMKSDLDFEHDDHPLSPFLKWVGTNMDGNQFQKLGVKNVFSMYQSSTGNTDKIIEKQIQDVKKKLFLDLEDLDNSARSLSRNTQTNINDQQGQMYKGIDLDRYVAEGETAYRTRMYEKADMDTQLKLESYVYSGKFPE